MTADLPPADLPAGFEPTPMGGPFVALVGPFCVARRDGVARLGLRIDHRHVNALGICHGGLLATFVDMLMPVVLYHDAAAQVGGRFLPTIGAQVDFVAPVYHGDWLEGTGEVVRATRSLVFAQGLLRVGDEVVARCSGIYKIAGEVPPGQPGMFTEGAPVVLPRRA